MVRVRRACLFDKFVCVFDAQVSTRACMSVHVCACAGYNPTDIPKNIAISHNMLTTTIVVFAIYHYE